MNAPKSLIADLIELLDSERRYEFEERAGIIEFDAGQTRDQAELLALVDLLRTHPAALVRVTVLQVEVQGSTEFVITTDVDRARDHFASQSVVTVRDVVTLAEVIAVQFGGMARLTSLQ